MMASEVKQMPEQIWASPEGEYGQGFDAVRLATWSDKQEYGDGYETVYMRADIANDMLKALRSINKVASPCADGRTIDDVIRDLDYIVSAARAAIALVEGCDNA